MYVDFNGRRIDLGKKFVAAIITVAIVGGALAVWQFWPRERAVYVNQPSYQQPVQQPTNIPVPQTAENARCETGRVFINEQVGCNQGKTCPSGTAWNRSLGCVTSELKDSPGVFRSAEQSRADKDHGCLPMMYWSQKQQRCSENPYLDRY